MTTSLRPARLPDLVWRRPYALLPLPPLFWAGNLVIGRAFAQELPPFGLTFWRWVIASAVLLPFVWRALAVHRRTLLAHWPVITACAASGLAGYPLLNYIALHGTPAATAAMLNSTLPLMVPLFAWAIAREAPRPRVVAGIVLSFLGVGWIVGRGDPATLAALSIGGGEVLVLLAAAGYALYSVLLRYRPKGVPDMVFMAALTVTTAVLMLPFWLAEAAAGRSIPVEPYAIASLLFIGIFSSLLGAGLWNRCVATLGPALTGASFHLVAVYSSALAFLLLGEPVRGFHLIGIGLILLGFAIAVVPGGAAIPRLPSRISRALTDCLSRLRERSETRSGSG
ncbi:DMT family transporter [Inquilinus sp. Marseille-Q2685]|uniref:DMT family transporter n=1 Tax=Inquilinus sp. Marseille-Q2685 TaxID=2866581 RepID=UPI001CE44423|nr:DMT family transporter [Inquilinus sp. Marseille-Q2685]